MFNRPVGRIRTVMLNASQATLAASPDVVSKKDLSRHTVSITATDATVYIGDKEVTASNGLPVKAGETFTFPVESGECQDIYVVGGNVILTEWA